MSGDDTKKDEKPVFTKADAAKAVKRTVPVLDDDGKLKRNKDREIITKPQAVKEEEVFDFKLAENGDVTVVTTDGQKLLGKAE